MSNVIEIDMNDPGHLVDPPIVDGLYRDVRHHAWTVSFVPEDAVSKREKESVTVAANSSDGHRIELRVGQLSQLLGFRIERIVHSGGGDFSFMGSDGQSRSLADAGGSGELSMRVYVILADIAMTAQITFLAVSAVGSRL